MKSFIEEYGIIIVAAIVIVAMIVVGCVLRDKGTEPIKPIVNNFLNKADSTNIGGCYLPT